MANVVSLNRQYDPLHRAKPISTRVVSLDRSVERLFGVWSGVVGLGDGGMLVGSLDRLEELSVANGSNFGRGKGAKPVGGAISPWSGAGCSARCRWSSESGLDDAGPFDRLLYRY
jgi:hypothetical protein